MTISDSKYFSEQIVSLTPFVPHSYADIEKNRVYPPGAVPEPAYNQAIGKYCKIESVDVSRMVYQSDGVNVIGMMATPENVNNNSTPIILYNRGGMGEYGKLTVINILRMMVPLAREGYLVFASNYRGNDDSEGEEEFGGADIHDVLNLLQLAKSHPAWDGKNIFMVGHSRGGMMTTLAMKHGAKINAAISIAGLSDIRSWLHGNGPVAQLFHTLYPDEAKRNEELVQRSSQCWPEAINAPLLLLHGDADEAVSNSHSTQLAEKLEALGKPYKLVIYPGGNHALIRQWTEVLVEIKSWLKRYRHH